LVVGSKPSESLGNHTEDRTYELKLTRRRVQSTKHNLNLICPEGLNITNRSSEFENSGIINSRRQTSQEVIHDAITRRHPPIPAPGLVESHQDKQHLQQHLYSKAEYTNTEQDLTVG
jgi:hypothetical protein